MITHLLSDIVQFAPEDQVLILNSASDPIVARALRSLRPAALVIAEDNVATLANVARSSSAHAVRHLPFHTALTEVPTATIDIALLNLLYQPGKLWMLYALSVAAHALKIGGKLYVTGGKDRGILTLAKRMQELFGNVDTLEISKGHRVLCSTKKAEIAPALYPAHALSLFAASKLDEGTQMLLEALAALPLREDEQAVDLGCGAGYVGLYLAHRLPHGHVTMLDASLAAVAASELAVARGSVESLYAVEAKDDEAGEVGNSDGTIDTGQRVQNVTVLPSDVVQAVSKQRFDLVATNPPFHQAGIQTREIAERFIREAAQVLRPQGRLLLVANRFLPYEPTLRACFRIVQEVHGNTRFKVLCATTPIL